MPGIIINYCKPLMSASHEITGENRANIAYGANSFSKLPQQQKMRQQPISAKCVQCSEIHDV